MDNNLLQFLTVWVAVLLCYSHLSVNAVSVEEDLTLTSHEKRALDKFKPRVLNLLPHNYMKQDIYLIRWLRARNLNLNMAEQMLKSNLRWRRENNMDTINDEDWSDMVDDFPYTNDNFDKTGRPIGTINLGPWNVRRMAVAGKLPRLSRYMSKLLEEATQSVVTGWEKGNNVTQWKVLINLDGFNQIQHACPICLPYWAQFVNTYEERYPGFADKIININTPPIYQIVLNIVLPLFSPTTRNAVKYFGQDKREWMAYLDKEIDRSQRRPEFGGTLQD